MIKFAGFALYFCLSAALLIVWPVMAHPTLPRRKKLVISSVALLVLVPGALVLYAWLGVPQMAGME